MNVLLRIVIAALSAGWVIPLAFAGKLMLGWLMCSASDAACSFPHIATASNLFFVACTWLGGVVFAWTLFLTRNRQ